MSDVPCTRSQFRLRGGASGGLEGALIQESSPPHLTPLRGHHEGTFQADRGRLSYSATQCLCASPARL